MIHLQSVRVRYNQMCAAKPTIYFYQSICKKSVQDKASEDRFYFVRICISSNFKILKVPNKTTAIFFMFYCSLQIVFEINFFKKSF